MNWTAKIDKEHNQGNQPAREVPPHGNAARNLMTLPSNQLKQEMKKAVVSAEHTEVPPQFQEMAAQPVSSYFPNLPKTPRAIVVDEEVPDDPITDRTMSGLSSGQESSSRVEPMDENERATREILEKYKVVADRAQRPISSKAAVKPEGERSCGCGRDESCNVM